MQDLTRAQKARVAIQSFKTIANALALRGYFRPSGRMGQALAECLITLGPEIYGSMNDPRVVELKGLEYVMDRLPRGIEKSTRIILTDEEQFGESQFEKIVPLKRRRTCYRISEKEFCFVITRGITEIYDILTHITFLNIEAKKIQSHIIDGTGNISYEWKDLEKTVQNMDRLNDQDLDRALWNLSIIVGRPYHETRDAYEYFANNKKAHNSNSDLFSMIYQLGKRVDEEKKSKDNLLIVYMTPTLMNIIAHQYYGRKWSDNIKKRLKELNLHDRPLHIISANLHSVVNLLYGYGTTCNLPQGKSIDFGEALYDFIQCIREKRNEILNFAAKNGFYELSDRSGSNIDVQIIDTAYLASIPLHPVININPAAFGDQAPVLLVMDYAFGAQAFEVMDCLLMPYDENQETPLKVKSISIMGKAGILPGKKGDIMLATAHVLEGSTDNYMVENDLTRKDFDPDMDVYEGPMITVLGTSLQNRDLLQRFQSTWNTVGLEMEGGHYQRAISAAIIRRHIPKDVKVRYAYYASDNPLVSGQTLAAGEMGPEGIRPTYMVTRVILEKILG
jgi:hypothetical protein